MNHWLELYRKHLQARLLTPSSIGGEMMMLERFMVWLAEKDLRDVTLADLQNYHAALQRRRKPCGEPHSLRHCHNQLRAVKRLCRFLRERGQLLVDPCAELPPLRNPPRGLPRGILTAAQVVRLLAQPDLSSPLGYRDRAMIELVYSCGLRGLELCRLSIYDLDFEKRLLLIRQAKGKKDRLVPVGQTAAHYVREYLAQVRPLFLQSAIRRGGGARDKRRQENGRANRKSAIAVDRLFLSQTGTAMKRPILTRIIKHHALAAGLPAQTSAHSLRHACATEMLRGGASVRHVQEMLGHAQLTTTQLYTRVLPFDLQRVHARTAPSERRRSAAAPAFEHRHWQLRKKRPH